MVMLKAIEASNRTLRSQRQQQLRIVAACAEIASFSATTERFAAAVQPRRGAGGAAVAAPGKSETLKPAEKVVKKMGLRSWTKATDSRLRQRQQPQQRQKQLLSAQLLLASRLMQRGEV